MPYKDSRKRSQYNSNYRKKNNELLIRYCRNWRRNNKYKARYGITNEEYDALWIEQLGLCAICYKQDIIKNKELGIPEELSVDHNHKTGKIRGLLCRNCNIGLGNLKDSISLLKNGISYLSTFDN